MKPEKQEIAIAIACGWKAWDHPDVIVVTAKWLCPRAHMGNPDGMIVPVSHIPDYLHDLNACHEMEKVLTPGQHRNYAYWLIHLCGTLQANPDNLPIGASYHATAAQRCEAFLRTLNLWEEDPS